MRYTIRQLDNHSLAVTGTCGTFDTFDAARHAAMKLAGREGNGLLDAEPFGSIGTIYSVRNAAHAYLVAKERG